MKEITKLHKGDTVVSLELDDAREGDIIACKRSEFCYKIGKQTTINKRIVGSRAQMSTLRNADTNQHFIYYPSRILLTERKYIAIETEYAIIINKNYHKNYYEKE